MVLGAESLDLQTKLVIRNQAAFNVMLVSMKHHLELVRQ